MKDKLRIAVQNPIFIFDDQSRNFNGYNYKFVEKYCDYIFLYARPWHYFKYKKKLKELGWKKKIVLTIIRLNKVADALLCFNGRPYLKPNEMTNKVKVKKIFHVMDFSERIDEISEQMDKGQVDLLLGYCRHDYHSSFFRKFFSKYCGRVIPVSFGYSERFKFIVPFEERKNKCIALGSVNPINDPLINQDGLKDFIAYYSEHEYSHEIRKAVVDHVNEWSNEIDSMLPVYPNTKNPNYNAVDVLNEYSMFLNDASIDKFPPARTYEGIACGCVMVGENLQVFKELGFEDGVNCVLFEQGDYHNMLIKIRYYMDNPQLLKKIQLNSLELAKKFSHESVADTLNIDIVEALEEKVE